MNEENNIPENSDQQLPQMAFSIQKIYLKDISFETPSGFEVLGKAWSPKIQQDLNIQVTRLDESLHEVVLLLTITARIENKPIFLVEIKQAGLFGITGLEGMQLSHAINTLCPQILFPYAREAIDSILVRGGFPPLMLAPINFDAVFAQAMMNAQQQAQMVAENSNEVPATIN